MMFTKILDYKTIKGHCIPFKMLTRTAYSSEKKHYFHITVMLYIHSLGFRRCYQGLYDVAVCLWLYPWPVRTKGKERMPRHFILCFVL